MTAKAFSFGGGVQSVACLVLAAQGRIDYKTFVFANVGDDSEYPETMTYLRDIAIPYAEANGLQLVEVRKTLLEKLHRTPRSIDIPVRMQNGAPGNRSCTADFKIKPVAKWMKANGATKDAPGTVGIGISTDEASRQKPSQLAHITNHYPLIDLGISRDDCKALIRDAGLPVPPKSSCWFCPYHDLKTWRHMLSTDKEHFDKAVALEALLNARRATLGKDNIYFSSRLVPLNEAVSMLHLFTTDDDGRYSCGPFTCDGTPPSGGDPFEGLITRKLA
jgi:hypothetical protein